jgi:hypothetical protein
MMNNQEEIMCGCGHEIDVHLKHQGCTKCTCKFKPSDIARLELLLKNDNEYDTALEWAASWIIGAQLSGHGVEVQRYANTMAMSIRSAKRGLTQRAADKCPRCHGFCHVAGDGTVVMVCPACDGTGIRR